MDVTTAVNKTDLNKDVLQTAIIRFAIGFGIST
jgi:hypothetical protein